MQNPDLDGLNAATNNNLYLIRLIDMIIRGMEQSGEIDLYAKNLAGAMRVRLDLVRHKSKRWKRLLGNLSSILHINT